jgi:integrase
VEQSSKQIEIEHFGAHDLRRTCAKLYRKSRSLYEFHPLVVSVSLSSFC